MPVPYVLLEPVEKQLDEVQKQDIISPVEFGEWAEQILCIPNGCGTVKICRDYKVTVNT